MSEGAVQVFLSAAAADARYVDALLQHLGGLSRAGIVQLWHRGKIPPGADIRVWMADHFDTAEVVVPMVSADFLASEYPELERALDLSARTGARVVPVLVRPVDLEGSPLTELGVLPRSGVPISRSKDAEEEVYLEIVAELRAVATGLRQRSPATTPPAVAVGPSRMASIGRGSILDAPPPFPWWHPNAPRLLELLQTIYGELHAAQFVAAQVEGLHRGRLVTEQGIERYWQTLLESAAEQAKLRALLDVVLRDRSVVAYHGPLREVIAPPG